MNCLKFFIEFENDDKGNLIQIDEPIGWDEITIKLETPKREFFGRNVSFSGGNFKLTFTPLTGGKNIGHKFEKLIEYFNCYGFNSCINLYVEECDETILVGMLNFKDAKTDSCSFIECEIIQQQDANLILERFDTQAEILGADTLNGLTGKEIALETICLKGKAIKGFARQEVFQTNENFPDEYYKVVNIPTDNYKLDLFNLDVNSDDTIRNNLPFINSIPIYSDDYVFQILENSTGITVNYNLDLSMGYTIGGSDFNIRIRLSNENNSQEISNTILHTGFIPTTPLPPANPYFDFNFNGNINLGSLQSGTKIYFYIELLNGGLGAYLFFRNKPTSFLEIDANTFVQDSEHEVPRLNDFICKIVDYISDTKVSVSSPEFDVGGAFYDYFVPNGYQIRQIQDKYQYNFKDLIESLNAIFGVGYQINGSEIFVGTIKEFYKPELCRKIDSLPVEYEQGFDDRLINNLFEFDYKTKPKDEVNTIDEFNTKIQINIPIEKASGSFKVKSELIASGYLIEFQRRKQFEDATESTGNDDKVFIINGNYNSSLSKYENRTTENISDVSNLISPETSYNLAISPFQNFSRWACWVLSAMIFKTENERIKATFFEQNGEMISRILNSNSFSEINQQKFDLLYTEFLTPIFEPIEVKLSIPKQNLTYYKLLEDDLLNKRGYHTILDAKGNEVDIFITELEYKPKNGLITITGTKKNINYV